MEWLGETDPAQTQRGVACSKGPGDQIEKKDLSSDGRWGLARWEGWAESCSVRLGGEKGDEAETRRLITNMSGGLDLHSGLCTA